MARQRADCEALVHREGWHLSGVYVDNDLSAYDGRHRPEYRRLLNDLSAGRVHAIVTWHPDRLHRSPRELEEFIDAVEAAGAQVRTVTAGEVDVSTPSGRMTARVGAAVARHESEQKAERIRRKMAELAESGRSNGGPRTFGYEPDHHTVRESEASLVREAATRALSGESLRSIAGDWNERGIPTVRAADGWSYQAMRRMLLSPRLAAIRTHREKVVGPGAWPAILDRETHEQLKTRLEPRPQPQHRVRKHLLTGLLYCGNCGVRLYMSKTSGGGSVYRCVRDPGRGQGTACGRLSVVAPALEAEVGEQVLRALSGPGLAEALAAAAGGDEERRRLSDRLQADEARLEELASDYADSAITRSEWRAARERLTQRITDTRQHLQSDNTTGILSHLPSGEDALRAKWSESDVTWRRAVVDALVDRVDVAPKGHRGGKAFDPDRIQVVWRH